MNILYDMVYILLQQSCTEDPELFLPFFSKKVASSIPVGGMNINTNLKKFIQDELKEQYKILIINIIFS